MKFIFSLVILFVLSACNTSKSAANTKAVESEEVATNNSIKYVDFSLVNKSAKSIPLLIPGVMNPNLSPFGTSGVGLKVGQEVLFKENGKKYIFFVVDQSYAGKSIDVAQKMKLRRAELGLK